MPRSKPVQHSDDWRHIYHEPAWSLIGYVANFLVMCLGALLGVGGLIDLSSTWVSGASHPLMQSTQLSGWMLWLSFGACVLVASGSLRELWHLLLDSVRPAHILEVRLDRVEVRWVAGASTGYHVCTITAGAKSWDVPKELKTRMEPGATVRLRCRAGTGAISDVWIRKVLREEQ